MSYHTDVASGLQSPIQPLLRRRQKSIHDDAVPRKARSRPAHRERGGAMTAYDENNIFK